MKYTTALGDKICDLTAHSSIGLRHICEKLGIPYSTATSWIYDPKHEMYNKYIHAKQMQLGHLADEILEIIDESANDYTEVVMKDGTTKMVQNKEAAARRRIRIQGRIAIITKLAPILYKAKPEKITHKVIMTPPPDRKPTPESKEEMSANGYTTPPSPACPEHVEGERAGQRSEAYSAKWNPAPPEGTGLTPKQWDDLRNNTDGSSPKTTPKRLPNGDLEWIGENGHRYVSKRVSYR